MHSKLTEIEVYDLGLSSFSIYDNREPLKKYGYKVKEQANRVVVDLTINRSKVRLKIDRKWKNKPDVCVIDYGADLSDFIEIIKRKSSNCKKRFQNASLIVVGFAEGKSNPESIKKTNLAGFKPIN